MHRLKVELVVSLDRNKAHGNSKQECLKNYSQ
jgi:hypothetical protein